jgi:hypothetical protein
MGPILRYPTVQLIFMPCSDVNVPFVVCSEEAISRTLCGPPGRFAAVAVPQEGADAH